MVGDLVGQVARTGQVVTDEMENLLGYPVVVADHGLQQMEGVAHEHIGLHGLDVRLLDALHSGFEVGLGLVELLHLEASQAEQNDLDGVPRDVDARNQACSHADLGEVLHRRKIQPAAPLDHQANDSFGREIPDQLEVPLPHHLQVHHDVRKNDGGDQRDDGKLFRYLEFLGVDFPFQALGHVAPPKTGAAGPSIP